MARFGRNRSLESQDRGLRLFASVEIGDRSHEIQIIEPIAILTPIGRGRKRCWLVVVAQFGAVGIDIHFFCAAKVSFARTQKLIKLVHLHDFRASLHHPFPILQQRAAIAAAAGHITKPSANSKTADIGGHGLRFSVGSDGHGGILRIHPCPHAQLATPVDVEVRAGVSDREPVVELDFPFAGAEEVVGIEVENLHEGFSIKFRPKPFVFGVGNIGVIDVGELAVDGVDACGFAADAGENRHLRDFLPGIAHFYQFVEEQRRGANNFP